MQPQADRTRNQVGEKRWRKSSFSDGAGYCVEVGMSSEGISLRDSKYQQNPANNPAIEPILSFTSSEWLAFVAGVKAGEFDM